MPGNPDHKKRADGSQLGSKTAQRMAKKRAATGDAGRPHPEVGNGSQRLGLRRIWGAIFRDDDD